MKKISLLILGVLLITVTSCTNDETSNEEIEILSPDKDKQQCTGCDNG